MNAGAIPTPLISLIDLTRRARHARSVDELGFMLVNDSHQLAVYRQAALWFSGQGVKALSGVVQVEANAPYCFWLDKVMAHCAATFSAASPVDAQALPADLAQQWADWLPAYGQWVPIAATEHTPAGGLLLARDVSWTEQDSLLLAEWTDAWSHAWVARQQAGRWQWPRQWAALWSRLRHPFASRVAASAADAAAQGPWWKERKVAWAAAAVLALLLFPVRLTVLAPGQLVPANPDVIRAPLEGVLGTFHVQPNDRVRQGQPLFSFDEAILRSKLNVALQSLATSEAEYRQAAQQTLTDAKAKAMLAPLSGRIEERRTEANYLRDQLGRAQVASPRDGVVLFDDPSEWVGRPVTVGELIMRVASPGDVEVEAWVAVADALPLSEDAAVTLYLNSTPLSPVEARLRYLSHEAVARPDGTYAYRLRARLVEKTDHRVGLKGTVRVSGGWVPLVYWVMRRPWAGLRGFLGW